MNSRIDYFSTSPLAFEILIKQEGYLNDAFIGNNLLLELVKLRVSQINQCAFCIDMHSKDALKQGESVDRLLALNAWRDSALYNEKEQFALSWAEQLISNVEITNSDFQTIVKCLGEKLTTDLTIAVNAINSWNKIVKAFKPVVGSLNVS